MGNFDLARKGAQIMDELAGFDHLPEISLLCLSQRREGLAVSASFYSTGGHRSLGCWAYAFGVPVRLVMSQPVSRIKTRLLLAGEWVVEIEETAHAAEVLAYATRCGLTAPWDKPVTLSAQDYLRAVEAEMAVAS